MTHRTKVDAATLWDKRNVKVSVNIPGIYTFQVCCGGGGWPTPCEVGIYLDADCRQCCIIDWPRPCAPVRFSCEYGEFLVHLDTATDYEILAAKEVAADFFRGD
jgi:hypothetical protein